MGSRTDQIIKCFGSRFIVAVLMPVIMLALGMTVFAFLTLRTTADQADGVSLDQQKQLHCSQHWHC